MNCAVIDRIPVLRRARARSGAAFLILVVAIVIVVLGATRALLHNEIRSQRASQDRLRRQTMLTAIERVSQIEFGLGAEPGDSSGIEGGDAWKLPLDEVANEFLEVNHEAASGRIVVRWVRGGEVIDELFRDVALTDLEKK